MVLDECPPYPCTREYAKSSLERTTRWAKRAKEHFEMKMKDIPQEKRPLLFGIVQGSVYEDLRQDSAEQLVALDFDGYAIGGVAVGEPRETLGDVLAWTIPSLPEDKPRYLMGLGRPEEIVRAVEAGVDMFDCVIPTREGRHGRLFVEKPAHNSSGSDSGGEGPESIDSFYATINIKNEQFTEDFSPVDEMCDCVLCTRYTKSYLRHLFAVGEPLAGRLASVHNLRFYLRMMQKLRNE
jgi:queuine tRNA-ribosyltransferase